MNCKIYEVGHDGFHWRLSQRNTHLSVPYPFKESAVLAARQLALASQPAQVVIRTPAGDIEAEWLYDPERPINPSVSRPDPPRPPERLPNIALG